LSELPPATDALLSKPIWTVEDVASYVGLPVKTIYKLRAEGDLCPGYRVGRWLRFKRADVLAWFESKRD
jgi:excisionase family DNA binding protein